jgi:hypothetical protein
MKRVMKGLGCGVLIALVLLLASPTPSEAGGHVSFSFGIPLWFGPGYWGPGPWWGPPYYYNAPPYSSAPSPMVIQQPPVYEQSAPPPQAPVYWYYCQNPQGYYPYIQQCPNGWMQVVPPATPPRQ